MIHTALLALILAGVPDCVPPVPGVSREEALEHVEVEVFETYHETHRYLAFCGFLGYGGYSEEDGFTTYVHLKTKQIARVVHVTMTEQFIVAVHPRSYFKKK